MDLLIVTFSSLRAHGLRFGLTSLGILWGSFMLTYLSASLEGLDRHFTHLLETTGPKLVIAWPGAILKSRVGERGARQVELDNDDVDRIATILQVELASQNAVLWAQVVRSGRRTKLLNVTGVSPQTSEIRNFAVAVGRFVSQTDVDRGARVAFLGHTAAERLFGFRSAVGETLQIESIRFRVIGVAREKGEQLIGGLGRDDNAVLIPYSTAQRLLQHGDGVAQVVFAPTTREESGGTTRRVREVLGLHHHFDPDVDSAISFFNVHDVMQIIYSVFFGLRIFLVSAGVVTLLVGAVSVMNIMLVVVGERTSEIGLRKAVGGSRREIFVQFLAEATAVCGLSGVAGAAMGVGMIQLTARYTPEDGALTSMPILDPFTVTVIVVSLVAVGIVAGVVPAVRAARVEPAEALRSV
ncbi:MAG: ABC transporter permease [Myxococcota bacterium]